MKTASNQSHRPLLSLQDATFRLGDRLVFEHTTWTFHQGEQWAIVGANGSGKSLLAEALRGRWPLVGGSLDYHFRPPPGTLPEEAIGHVSFEDRKQELHGTVAQSRWNSIEEEGSSTVQEFLSYDRVMEVNPYEITDRHAVARRQFAVRMRRAISWLRLEPFLRRTLLTLSNGETQRVHLARALCHPLSLVILDEPFAGLDAATRVQFQTILARLMHSSLRVLLVTTRVEDLPPPITHVLCLDDCRIVAAGPQRSVLGNPAIRHLLGLDNLRRRSAKPISRLRTRTLKPAGPPLVHLKNVTVAYGEATVLREVNWTVEAGQSWALLGPNGSGKTTLLSLVLGDNPQVYGNDVQVLGHRRGTGESVWQLKRQIGWVSPDLHLHYSGEGNCLEVVASGFHETAGLFTSPTSRQRKAARQALRELRLEEVAATPFLALSAGVQRMVLLARALVKKPKLLVLDEPGQGLDPQHRRRLNAAVDDLIRAGTVTAIFVTHRPDEIPTSIRRILKLSKGRARIRLR